jgi:hypothetical protein
VENFIGYFKSQSISIYLLEIQDEKTPKNKTKTKINKIMVFQKKSMVFQKKKKEKKKKRKRKKRIQNTAILYTQTQ